jgi:hypothetical protein
MLKRIFRKLNSCKGLRFNNSFLSQKALAKKQNE